MIDWLIKSIEELFILEPSLRHAVFVELTNSLVRMKFYSVPLELIIKTIFTEAR
jgi:hypothetical protein